MSNGSKKITTVSIDTELYEIAKAKGIGISKITNDALRKAIPQSELLITKEAYLKKQLQKVQDEMVTHDQTTYSD